jgi:hypothetical protein
MTTTQQQIDNAAECLLGICDEWNYLDIEQFLDWQLDNLDDLADGYPKEIMTREYEDDIMEVVNNKLNRRMFKNINRNLGLATQN